ncbi:site-2 protease family protein [Nitrogeniibacter mangrovi]|uniref:Site-2 protease family protein n=1 Tax=Nitrogeniibacter mangrovi TaxID=2016596 RepID=A0A6C1B2I4_9RHOO|nr:site-2 protease family protein [Nitrogeniibacter mangrovi]QID17593.1 site-2 protease family protein [Nitrogeniibacter mangrovi]
MEDLISTVAIWALPVLLAITLHEAAHGYVARHFGDPTADMLGRITLNPLKHIDPVGTVLVPGMILAIGALTGGTGFLFGWAKPVPVDFSRLRNPKKDMFWVAAAGPAANLLMTFMWAALLKLAIVMPDNGYRLALASMADAGITINLILMVLNLLPIPPLDGGRIAVSLLPMPQAAAWARIEPYGFPILIILLMTGVLGQVLGPLIGFLSYFLSLVFGF